MGFPEFKKKTIGSIHYIPLFTYTGIFGWGIFLDEVGSDQSGGMYIVPIYGHSLLFLEISFTERECDHISMPYLQYLFYLYNVSPVLQTVPLWTLSYSTLMIWIACVF